MIRRKTSNYTQNQEALHQASFTAMKGVDCSKAPTSEDTVLLTKNLDVDYDGGLVLRKPLVFQNKYLNGVKCQYLYDKTTLLQTAHSPSAILSPVCSLETFVDIYGESHDTRMQLQYLDDVFDLVNVVVQNTPTTTILSNVVVKLDVLESYIEQHCGKRIILYNRNVEPSTQLRMFKLYKNELGNWVLNMLTPEPTTVTTSDISVDFNTANNNTLAVRDSYYASQTSINGILAYVQKNPTETVSKTVRFTYDLKLNDDSTYHTYAFSADGTASEDTILNLTVRSPNFYSKVQEQYPGRIMIDVWASSPNVFRSVKIKFLPKGFSMYNPIWVSKTLVVGDKGVILNENGVQRANLTLLSESGAAIDADDWFSYEIEVEYSYDNIDYIKRMAVDELTESENVKILNSVNHNGNNSYIVLKAFFNKPNLIYDQELPQELPLVVKWERSSDGFIWENLSGLHPYQESYNVSYISETASTDLTGGNGKSLSWNTEMYHALNLPSYENIREMETTDITIEGYEDDDGMAIESVDFEISTLKYPIHKRVDCLIQKVDDNTVRYMYRITLSKIKRKPESITDADTAFILDTILDQRVFNFNIGSFSTVSDVFKNPLTGNLIYWKHALCSYGNGLGSTIYVSNADSAVFPMSRIIDLGTYQTSDVTKLVPWRDYLIAFTKHNVNLIQAQEIGFTTKVINTFVGVSERDADTCVAILNGLIFKSGTSIYTLSPTYNSGIDTILNLADVSKPIKHLLEQYDDNFSNNFAFSTSEDYYLCMPYKANTICLKYNYTNKIWTFYELPIRVSHYDILNVEDIRFFDEMYYSEYRFENENLNSDTYADLIWSTQCEPPAPVPVPIEFSLDSGQKTDNISLTKQFVESKIIVATLGSKDNFSMDVRVDIEGNTFKRHVDLNTDGALLRSSADDVLTLGSNTDFTENQDTFNVMRQMFLRYAGKGKTIRHIISGQSLYKFKIYETFYRYKILNVKQ